MILLPQSIYVYVGHQVALFYSSLIPSVLETAQEDFEKLKQETEAAESDASAKFDKFKQESTITKSTKEAEVKGKTQEKAGVQENIGMVQLFIKVSNFSL